MTKKKPGPSGRVRRELSTEMFFSKHEALVAELFRPPGEHRSGTLQMLAGIAPGLSLRRSRFMTAVDQLKQTEICCLLETARQENCPEAFKEILEVLLLGFLHVKAPDGVFAPSKRSPGAPTKELTREIHIAWKEMGSRWPLHSRELDILAKRFYPKEFGKSKPGSNNRRNLRERIRGTVLRSRIKLAASKFAANS